MSRHIHETLHRGEETLEAMRETSVFVCGAGALGANLVESLARSGFERLGVVDFDHIEERNLSTQPYERRDVGAQKAETLARHVFRAVDVEVEAQTARLTDHNADDLLGGRDLVVDCFDNTAGRRAVFEWAASAEAACLHVGLADGYGEAIWNPDYTVPSDGAGDVCDYPLARSLVLLTTGIACEGIADWVGEGEKRNVSMTLRDFAVRVRDSG